MTEAEQHAQLEMLNDLLNQALEVSQFLEADRKKLKEEVACLRTVISNLSDWELDLSWKRAEEIRLERELNPFMVKQ